MSGRVPPRPARPTPAAAGARAAPARAAALLLASWLALTAGPLVAGARGDPAATATLVAHATLLGFALLAAWRPWRALAARAAAAWLPLVAVPALYGELPRVAAGWARLVGGAGPGGAARMHDAAVVGWELGLFGPLLHASPAVALAARAPWTPLSELLHLAYLAYYVIIYGPPLLLWWLARPGAPAGRGPAAQAAEAFSTSVLAVLLTFVACYAVFVTFPVQGPWYTWQTGGAAAGQVGAGLPLAGPVRDAVQHLLVAGSSRGTAFPSSHVAVSVAQTVALARVAPAGVRWLVPALGVATALLALGAVYGGYHYGVDALAGAAAGWAAGAAGARARPTSPGPLGDR